MCPTLSHVWFIFLTSSGISPHRCLNIKNFQKLQKLLDVWTFKATWCLSISSCFWISIKWVIQNKRLFRSLRSTRLAIHITYEEYPDLSECKTEEECWKLSQVQSWLQVGTYLTQQGDASNSWWISNNLVCHNLKHHQRLHHVIIISATGTTETAQWRRGWCRIPIRTFPYWGPTNIALWSTRGWA